MSNDTVLRDSPLRSVLKCLSYRLIGTCSTAAIAWVVTGNSRAAFAIGAVEFVSKFALYYLHERAWARIPLGTVRQIPKKLAARYRQGGASEAFSETHNPT